MNTLATQQAHNSTELDPRRCYKTPNPDWVFRITPRGLLLRDNVAATSELVLKIRRTPETERFYQILIPLLGSVRNHAQVHAAPRIAKMRLAVENAMSAGTDVDDAFLRIQKALSDEERRFYKASTPAKSAPPMRVVHPHVSAIRGVAA